MKRWFYNGTFMADGTPISVAATSDVEAVEFMERGYEPVKTRTRKSGPAAAARHVKGRKPKRGAGGRGGRA